MKWTTIGGILEGLLYALFAVDAVALMVSLGRQSTPYEPYGGVSLVVILALIGLVRWLRGDY